VKNSCSLAAITVLCLGIAAPAFSMAKGIHLERRFVVKGLQASTEILIDRWGVPHIYATTRLDAFFSQGWNAARDRLWQIDLWRRSGLGELSAVLGSNYVAQDRAIRMFVYRGDMRKEWAAYGPEARQDTEAFVAGINAYITAAKADAALMPLEFKLAGYEPAFWNADDVVRIRNHGFALGAALQVTRAQALCKGGLAAAEFMPKISPPWSLSVPEGLDPCSIPHNVLDQYALAQAPVSFAERSRRSAMEEVPQQSLLTLNALSGRSQGSNNWVIASSKSATGRPILANDPHRDEGVPSLRYLAHLVAPGLNVIGAGEPALPGISIGHNDHVAFGLTIFLIAQEDLYVYDTNPLNPDDYRYQGGWESMQVVHEMVAVHGGPDRNIELKFTRHGPVVLEDPDHHRAYAVRATWLDTGGAPYFGSMRYARVRSVEQFAGALRHWGEPGENQIVADTTGKIGWFPAGFTPIRPNSDGLLPLPGDGRYEWNGYLDRDLLPSEINPARGYIATANQLNLPKDYPYAQRRVGFFWGNDFRFSRISEFIGGLAKVSVKDSELLQNDYVTLPGRRLIGVLKKISTPDSQLRDLIGWLAAWDDRVTAGSPQAALYEVWVSHHLGSAAIAQVAPYMPENDRANVSGSASEIVELMEHPNERLGKWPEKTRDGIMLTTLSAAFEETQRRLGPDRSTWQWGQLATALFEHPLSASVDEAQRSVMNAGPAPKAGDKDVVGAAAYRVEDFRLQDGASFRMVLDVGHWDDSVAVNTPGQSGDSASPHYRDLFPLWLSGKYFPLVYSRAAVEKATELRILLVPKGR
jgi:penicillin G amidase